MPRSDKSDQSDTKPVISAEWCPHPFEKDITFVRSTVTNVTQNDLKGETIVILVDVSGSMEPVMDEMRAKTKLWIAQLEKRIPKPRIILGAYDYKGEIIGDTAIDKNIDVNGLITRRLQTYMGKGLDAVVKQLQKATFDPKNTTMFILSDGADREIKSEKAANDKFKEVTDAVGLIRFVALGYGPEYSEAILEIIGKQGDCAHVYLKDTQTFDDFINRRSEEYLGKRTCLQQSFNGDTRTHDCGMTKDEEWQQLYSTNYTPAKIKKQKLELIINEQNYQVTLKEAPASSQKEIIELWVNEELKKILPKFSQFLINASSPLSIYYYDEEYRAGNLKKEETLGELQKKYIEQFSKMLTLLDEDSPSVLTLRTMLQQCVRLKSLSKAQSKEMLSTTSTMTSSAGRTLRMRNLQQETFGTTKFKYKNQNMDVVDRHFNFCDKKKTNAISLDAGVTNRPAIYADIPSIRQSIKLKNIDINSQTIDEKQIREFIALSRVNLGKVYEHKSQGNVGLVSVEHLLDPPKRQNTCRHHAFLTSILLGQHTALTSVNQFRGTAHNLDGHNFVICETKSGERYLIDSHHSRVFSMSTLSNRQEAIKYYEAHGLHGVLEELFKHGSKHWQWNMDEHPPLYQLTEEAVNAEVKSKDDTSGVVKPISLFDIAPNKYRCPLSGQIMRSPVIVFDQTGDTAVPYSFDYYNLQAYVQNQQSRGIEPRNPLTNQPIDMQRIFLDLNLLREMWVFVQNSVEPKEEASSGIEAKSMQGAKGKSYNSIELEHFIPLSEKAKEEVIERAKTNKRSLSNLPKLPEDSFKHKVDIGALKFKSEAESKEKPIERETKVHDAGSFEIDSKYSEVRDGKHSDRDAKIKPQTPPTSTSPSVLRRLQKFLKNIPSWDDADLIEFKVGLSDLEEKGISKEIVDQLKQLILNVAELEREEEFLKYSVKWIPQLKNNITSLMKAVGDFPKDKPALDKSLGELQFTANLLTNRKETIPLYRRLLFHVKTLIASVAKWMIRCGVAAGMTGGVAGAVVGAAGGAVGAAIVSSPVGCVLAPLGSATGAAAGFGVGATIGLISGGMFGATYGMCKGVKRISDTQDVITKDSADNLVTKIRNLSRGG